MSITLKRPMFRKGGEVMEGVMTGIKPREMFKDKGMSSEMAEQLKNVQARVDLIDAISGAGASPLANPLTQFLLQTGQNLIGGTAAGGTKLQEIVGATREPLSKAIAAQQKKDLSRRKIAASLLSKSNINEARKAYNEYGKAKYKTFEEFLPVYATMKLERKPRSAADQAQADKDAYVKSILRITDYKEDPVYNISEANKMYEAEQKVRKSENTKIDVSNFHIPKKVAKEFKPTGQKTKTGKSVVEAPSGINFIDQYVYYDVQGPGTYYRFDEARNILIPLGE
jgi:hypothetical protein